MEARRKGVPPHKFASWVHRTHGYITLFRQRNDGSIDSGHPCVVCRKALERHDMKIESIVPDGSGTVYRGYARLAPPSQPTRKMRTMLGWR